VKRLRGAIFLLLLASAAAADENSDLELIPQTIPRKTQEAPTAPVSRWQSKFRVEEAATVWGPRQGLAIPAPVALPDWQSLMSFDIQSDVKASRSSRLHLSDRMNLIHEDGLSFPSQENFRNDLRELYANAELADGVVFLQAGRINTRGGVALGFNPTDFFKTRSSVLQSSIDPSAARENRLGVFQVAAQAIFAKASLNVIAAPALEAAAPLAKPEPSLSLRLGQTNGENRFLAVASAEVLDLSPQLLVFHDDQGERLGVNLSHGVGSRLILYGEWAGGKMPALEARALKFAADTGTLPRLPLDLQPRFQNDVAIGGSWTSSSRFTVHLEYHYHESGLTADDLKFRLATGAANPLLGKELWLIRHYASDQQEPLMQNQVFVRLAIPDLFWTRHELDAVAFISPDDGSTTAQLASVYLVNDSWSLSFYWTSFLGSATSDEGTLPFQNIFAAKIGRYF